MFRVWGKMIKENRLVKDHVVCIDDVSMRRTQKVYAALDELCQEFNLSRPIWLEMNQKEFLNFAKTRFTADSFMEEIEFDYLEFQVIEEDW